MKINKRLCGIFLSVLIAFSSVDMTVWANEMRNFDINEEIVSNESEKETVSENEIKHVHESVYEYLDENTHSVTCTACDETATEEHSFVDEICGLCNFEALTEVESQVNLSLANNTFSFLGEGTQASPYLISTVDDLVSLQTYVNEYGYSFNEMYFLQTNDIDFNNVTWEPIGNWDFYFEGIYNGGNYAIKNINIYAQNLNVSGFFGCASGAIIKNLTITGKLTPNSDSATGVFCGVALDDTQFINLVNKVDIISDLDVYQIGGICGSGDSASFENCINYGTISGTSYSAVGGITGFYGNISNCKNYGVIKGDSGVGGINGDGGTVTKSINYGFVSGNSSVGGIVSGYCCNVSDSVNKGEVTGIEEVGGIIGYTYFGTIEHCYNSGKVTGTKFVGGIVGRNANCAIKYCYNVGEIDSSSVMTGGITGYCASDGSVSNCYVLSGSCSKAIGSNSSSSAEVTITNNEGILALGNSLDGYKDNKINDTVVGYPILIWEEAYPICTIFFDVNGGNALTNNVQEIEYGDKYSNMPIPTRDEWCFAGWYTAKEGGAEVTAESTCNENLTLFAHWINHTMGAEATCKAKAKCSVCGKEYGNLAEHTMETNATKATTSKNGKKETKCAICDKVFETTTIYAAKTVRLSATTYTYNGKVKKPTVVIKDSKGNKIASSNYTVTYPSGRKNVGKYTVKVTFKGDYSGTKSLAFKISPPKISISSVTAKSKGFEVKWAKKTKQTTGYEIQYSTSSTFKRGNKTIKITSNKTTSKAISKLTAKKKYYVRIRTYKTVKGTKYYSEWSAKKAVIVKK